MIFPRVEAFNACYVHPHRYWYKVPNKLPSEKKKLHEKAKKLANGYAWIVFNKRSIPEDQATKCTGRIMFKSKLESYEK